MTMPDERIHIGKMLDISDEDAAAVIKDVAVSVTAHSRMSDVVSELAAKYGKKAILAGMMLAKTFEANECVQDFGSGEVIQRDDKRKPTGYPVTEEVLSNGVNRKET